MPPSRTLKSCGCRTCDHRTHDLYTHPTTPSLIHLALITLSFRSSLSYSPQATAALNATLNQITDSGEPTAHPSRVTSWSPSLDNPKKAIVLTSASETCSSPNASAFFPLGPHLACEPGIQHIYFDYSVLSLSSSSPDDRIPCDIILLHAPNPGTAGTMGKRFGWDPKRSSLSAQMEKISSVSFSRPGDLVRDFWGWAELDTHPLSPSSSTGSEGALSATNGDWVKGDWHDFDDEDREDRAETEEETLVMIFQWSTRENGERFKHPLQNSFGDNGRSVATDMWDRNVAHPVRQLEGMGVKAEHFKLDLRGVGTMEERPKLRERSGSRRLSGLATGLGEKMSFWK